MTHAPAGTNLHVAQPILSTGWVHRYYSYRGNAMKIHAISTSYSGLVSNTCLAEVGNDVLCLDIDAEKIKKCAV